MVELLNWFVLNLIYVDLYSIKQNETKRTKKPPPKTTKRQCGSKERGKLFALLSAPLTVG